MTADMRTRSTKVLRTGGIVVAGVLLLVGVGALLVWALRPHISGALLGPVGPIVAFLVGAISFFSPCILPLVPGYLSFVSGLSTEEMDAATGRRRVLAGTVLFVLGFATMFTGLALGVTAAGQALLGNQELLTKIGGVLILVMGVAFLAPSVLPFMERERRPLLSRVKPGLLGAFPLGLAFAVGWSPCVGPGFGAILSLGYVEGSAGQAALLMFFFSMGFGMWFILSGLGMRRAVTASAWVRNRSRAIQRVGGGMMLVIGVLILSGAWDVIIGPIRELISGFASPL